MSDTTFAEMAEKMGETTTVSIRYNTGKALRDYLPKDYRGVHEDFVPLHRLLTSLGTKWTWVVALYWDFNHVITADPDFEIAWAAAIEQRRAKLVEEAAQTELTALRLRAMAESV